MNLISLSLLILMLLASTAAGQNLMVDGELPRDLKITIENTGTVQFANYYQNTILADGTVTFEFTSRGLPVQDRGYGELVLSTNDKKHKTEPAPTPPAKKDKLSKSDLLELARAFESSTFFQMQDSYYGDPTLKTGMCINHSAAKAISVTANGKTKRVYFFLGCSYGEYAPLAEFLQLYKSVETAISGVEIKEIRPPAVQH